MSSTGIGFRKMEPDDLEMVAGWLAEPHVSRWYLAGSSIEREIEDLRRSVAGEQPVNVLIVIANRQPIGWCQWYLCGDDPDWAGEIGAAAADVGIDYAIGSPGHKGRGIGTAMIAELVSIVSSGHPEASIFADPDALNTASRRVLEKNGFELMAIKSIPSEPTDDPMAIYRLRPSAGLNASERSNPTRSREHSR
jgi:aminoglycoside 6'-N-acetyltransferase